MKNLDKILLAVGIVLCAIGVCVCVSLGASDASKSSVKKTLRGAEVPAWNDARSSDEPAPTAAWVAPAFDLEEGWNYDLFSSPEISWNTKQKKYFAKELPPPSEEVFGLELKSISHPQYRFVIETLAGDRPVPKEVSPGRYAAVLTLKDLSKKNEPSVVFLFNSTTIPAIVLTDETDEAGMRTVSFNFANPATLPKMNAKLKTFRIVRGKSDTGAFFEKLGAVIIDESGRTPREFVVGQTPILDNARTEAIFTDGSTEWLYSETRVPGKKTPVCELAVRKSPNDQFSSLGSEKEITIDGNVFRIKGLDISKREARIEKQSSEVDKKTKAPKKTERVLSAPR